MTERTQLNNTRIVALDYARALAIAGMILTHLMPGTSVIQELAHGTSAALFAVLAGCSMHILSAKSTHTYNREIALRGLILIILSLILQPFSGQIQIVLMSMGIGFILLAWAPKLPTPWLLALLGVMAGLSAAIYHIASTSNVYLPFIYGPYPLFTWSAYLVAGILGYRLLVTSSRLRIPALVAGIAAGVALIPARAAWPQAAVHSGGIADVLLTIAICYGIIAAAVLIGTRFRLALSPLQVMGSMSLSVYILHVLTAGRLLTSAGFPNYPNAVIVSICGALIFAMAVSMLGFQRGPAEKALSLITKKAR